MRENFRAAKKLGERQEHGAFDWIRGALRIWIECADGFDGVAEKLDANGLRRFGRKDIDDAAADGVLSRHFAGDLLFVTGAIEKADQIFVCDGIVARDYASQIAIEMAVAHAPQSCLDRCDYQIGLAGCETPEGDSARFGNFRVRRAIFVR